MVQETGPPPAAVVDLNEARLIKRAKGGDTKAFEEIYRQFVPRVFGMVMRMVGGNTQAEELTQEVFIRVWEKLHLYSGTKPFTPWLMTLAANVVRSDWRSRKRRSDRETAMDEGREERTADLTAPSGARSSDALDLESAISKLPEGARHIFVLHDIEGYRHVEIAEMLGLAIGTTKAQLHRARRMLKEALAT